MCGIIGIMLADTEASVSQDIYDGLTMLQHRGQDAAGMVVVDTRRRMHTHKDCGLVRDVFKLQHMIKLLGFYGIGHCRYPTAGSSANKDEAQPFSTHIPFGLCIAHNGNLTNTQQMQQELCDRYHFNTDSDSELMLSLIADELLLQAPAGINSRKTLQPHHCFGAVKGLMSRTSGAYACLLMIAGHGLIAFRDPNGIRPLCYGQRPSATHPGKFDYNVASESVAVESLGFTFIRDVRPGEVMWFGLDGEIKSEIIAEATQLSPCIFEYVYFGRPDSVMDNVSVYRARQLMGSYLADKVKREQDVSQIDVVCPVPDTSRISALQCALRLGLPYEEGLTKNRYIARTFIMPGQDKRKKSVRKKLNPISSVFEGKSVLLVDDSIVRGTTSSQIIQMCRAAGAARVFFCSASPPVRFPNVYGIDMPVQSELVAFNRNEQEVAAKLGADWAVYLDIDSCQKSVMRLCKGIDRLDCSCFNGEYVTGDIDSAYLTALSVSRSDHNLAHMNKEHLNGDEQQVAEQGKVQAPHANAQDTENRPDTNATLSPKSIERSHSLGGAARRGRQIAGANVRHRQNSIDELRYLQDRFSGW